MVRGNVLAALVAGISAYFSLQAPAAVVVSDTFSRTSDLNGSVPDVVQKAGDKWTAVGGCWDPGISYYGTSFKTDGSVLQDMGADTNVGLGSGYALATLPLTLDTAKKTTLSFDFKWNGATGSYWSTTIGFANATNNNISAGLQLAYTYQGTGNKEIHNTIGGAKVASLDQLNHTYRIVLNAASGGNLVVDEYQGATLLASSTIPATTLGAQIRVQQSWGNGYSTQVPFTTIDNLSVDVTTVPEPTTTTMLGLGSAGLMMLRRQRKH